MATFFDRVQELLSLTGWKPANLYNAIGLDKTTFAKWKAGVTEANRDVLQEMSRRFLVSMDSLLAEEGTRSLEPSPILRRAHTALRDRVQLVEIGSNNATERLSLALDLLKETVPGLTIETWAAYLRTTVGGWLEIQHGYKAPTEENLSGAAHLLGWYELRDAWLQWLATGSLDRLKGPSEESMTRIMRRARMMGIVETDIAETMDRRLAERSGFTENK
jgi:hypothetical protein